MTYVGCFQDTSVRDLNFKCLYIGSLTNEKCFSCCQDANYIYAGNQNSNECYCGNEYGRYGASTSCSMKCNGNASQICGGFWANSVYIRDPTTTSTSTTTTTTTTTTSTSSTTTTQQSTTTPTGPLFSAASCNLTPEKVLMIGRQIDKNQNAEHDRIANKTKDELRRIAEKYKVSIKVKSSMGYIAAVYVAFIFSLAIFFDFIKYSPTLVDYLRTFEIKRS